MSEIISDLKKLDRTSIAAAMVILLIVVGLIATLVVLVTRNSSSNKISAPTTQQSTAVSKPPTNPPAQTTQSSDASNTGAEVAPTNTQTAAAQTTETPPKTEAAANTPTDASLPEDLAVLTALDPDRFSGDAYQLSELRFGHGNIYGTVKSNAQEMFSNVTLEITLYDGNLTPTGVVTVKLTGIKPGSSTKFVKETSSGPCSMYRVTGYIAS